MGIIHILQENVSNKIAAGEVVERPASTVKELVENSIDSGASSITVEIKSGGISYIRVTDNGSGMDEEDAMNSFIRHATSKIMDENDLININTLGFRGEALASIASVSEVEMNTKLHDEIFGTKIIITGGEIKQVESTGCQDGTTIIVKNLFFNTPARLKFLKKEPREAALVSDALYRLALSRPDISFKFINNDKMIFNTPGNGDLKNVILVLYGREFMDSLIGVSYKGNILSILGFIGNGDAARSNRNFQVFYINNRYIKNKMISSAVDNAYKTFLPVNKFAACILFITICPELIDVNVHPAKSEVKFQDEREVFSSVFNTVRSGLAGEVLIPDFKKNDYLEKVEQQELFKDNFDYSASSRPAQYELPSRGRLNLSADTIVKEYEALDKQDVITDKDYLFTENDQVKNLLPPLVIIGQCSLTYILGQGPDGLYIIDQHAAHERILYEKFKNSYEGGGVQFQELLTPLVIDLTPKELDLVRDNSDILSKLGFDIDFFGNNSVILRSVPFSLVSLQIKKLFLEIVDTMDSGDSSARSYLDNTIYTMACRSAVKAGDMLRQSEMEELINNLRRSTNPYTCPHGRPTIVRLTKEELERKFKRIQ